MPPFNLTHDKLRRLTPTAVVPPFDCGDTDLNDFLRNDAPLYTGELLTVTYLVVDGADIAAFFSLSNDTLTYDPNPDSGGRGIWNRITRNIPNPKRRKSYPAVKLGRLGVSSKHQSMGLGSVILDLLKVSFVSDNKTGCRFITVDAYNNPRTLGFYQRNEFDFLIASDEKEETRQMYFDLKPFYKLNLASVQTMTTSPGNPLLNVAQF